MPPLAEQHEIVRRVEALFARADAIEREVVAATKRAEALTQAVLAKAFRGVSHNHSPQPVFTTTIENPAKTIGSCPKNAIGQGSDEIPPMPGNLSQCGKHAAEGVHWFRPAIMPVYCVMPFVQPVMYTQGSAACSGNSLLHIPL